MNDLIEQTETPKTGGVLSEMTSSRASQEVQAAMVIAKRFPRDETSAVVKIKNACKRKKLAEMGDITHTARRNQRRRSVDPFGRSDRAMLGKPRFWRRRVRTAKRRINLHGVLLGPRIEH